MEVPIESVRRLDELIRIGHQDLRDTLFTALLLFSGLVVVGVLIEGTEYVLEHLPIHRLRLNPITGFPIVRRRLPSTIKGLAKFGWFLVLIGVGGEGVFEGLTSRADSILQTFNEIVLIDTQRQAASAIERAAKADLARVQLEASMMWRHLSKKQAEALCSVMPRAPVGASEDDVVQYRVMISSSPTDPEAWTYAREFHDAWSRCTGQPTALNTLPVFPTPVVFGLWIRTRTSDRDDPKSPLIPFNPAKRKALGNSVRKAVEGIGINVTGVSDDGGAVLIDIYVGPRFPPMAEETATAPAKKK